MRNGVPFAHADPEGYEDAAHEFQSAHSNVENALAGYQSCVSSSDAHEDCSREFQRFVRNGMILRLPTGLMRPSA
jgi:hypothetical protein